MSRFSSAPGFCIRFRLWRLCAFRALTFRARRNLLKGVAAAAIATPPVLGAAAFLRRESLTFREVDIFLPGLPKNLQGLRLVQLSDIHLSPFVSEALLARAVDMANETNAHVAFVTGDLISRAGDPLDTCIKQLKRLRSDAGTYGCMGNHEIYARAEEYITIQGGRSGMRFLRGESATASIWRLGFESAGVDYQRREKRVSRRSRTIHRPRRDKSVVIAQP